MRSFPILIPAGVGVTTETFQIDADLILVWQATGLFTLVLDGREESASVERGLKFERKADQPRFKSVRLINETATAQTVLLYLSSGENITDDRNTMRSEVARRGAGLYFGVPAVNAIAANAVLIELANETRCEIVINAPAANALPIWIFCAAAVNKGVGMAMPGQTYRTAYRGDVYVVTMNLTDAANLWATYYI